jgi:hypothetical protein
VDVAVSDGVAVGRVVAVKEGVETGDAGVWVGEGSGDDADAQAKTDAAIHPPKAARAIILIGENGFRAARSTPVGFRWKDVNGAARCFQDSNAGIRQCIRRLYLIESGPRAGVQTRSLGTTDRPMSDRHLTGVNTCQVSESPGRDAPQIAFGCPVLPCILTTQW